MPRMSLFLLLFCGFCRQEAFAQIPEWAIRQQQKELEVKQVSDGGFDASKFQFSVVSENPVNAIPERAGSKRDQIFKATQGHLQSKSLTSPITNQSSGRPMTAPAKTYFPVVANQQMQSFDHSVYQRSPAAVGTPIQMIPTREVTGPPSTITGFPAVSTNHFAYPPVSYQPYVRPTLLQPQAQSQITKRAFRYGDFGANTYHQRSTQSSGLTTTWSW